MKFFKVWSQRRKALKEVAPILRSMLQENQVTAAQAQELSQLRGFFYKEKMGSWRERFALYKAAARLPKNACVVEIGSWVGVSTTYLGCGLRSGGGGHLHAVDTFQGTTLNTESQSAWQGTVEKMGGTTLNKFNEHINAFALGKTVTPIESDSVSAAKNWPTGKTIDLLFIDGDHVYEAVKQDFTVWAPFVQSGGYILFHDFDSKHPGVQAFIEEALRSDLAGCATEQVDSLLIVKKN
jgi:predicted O-methyltransferase YrrM